MILIRIVAPHFVAGVSVGKHAAPIVRYMQSWSLARIRSYCESKGWRIEEVAVPEQTIEVIT